VGTNFLVCTLFFFEEFAAKAVNFSRKMSLKNLL